MENKDLPIHPHNAIDGYGSSFHGILANGENAWCSAPGGLTKREWFAGMALSGLCTRHWEKDFKIPYAEWAPEMAIEMADEILKQLEPK